MKEYIKHPWVNCDLPGSGLAKDLCCTSFPAVFLPPLISCHLSAVKLKIKYRPRVLKILIRIPILNLVSEKLKHALQNNN